MGSAAKRASRSGFRVLNKARGVCFQFKAYLFRGLVSEPQQADRGTPRGMAFGPEYDLEITCSKRDLGPSLPVAGNTVTARDGGEQYRIAAVKKSPGHNTVTLLVVQPTT